MVFATIYIFWFVSEILLNRMLRSAKTDRKNVDQNSLAFIWIVVLVSMAAAIFIANYVYLPIAQSSATRNTGAVIIIIGMAIRGIAVYQLGKYFTVDVTIRHKHEIISTGLYKYVRHPSYAGSLVSFVGFGLTLNNWLSLLVTVLPVFFSFIKRIRIEEKVLLAEFGSEYVAYKKKTGALFPKFF